MKKKPVLTLVCGVPRVGKSTWIKSHKANNVVISSDEIRKEFFGHQFHAPANQFVFGIAENMTNLLLKQGKNVIIDATNVTIGARASWRIIASKNEAKVKVVWVYSSKDNCQNLIDILERNYYSPKSEQVPDAILFRMMVGFMVPEAISEGNWFEVEEYHSKHGRKLPPDKRIKIDKDDDLYNVFEKWRLLWDVDAGKTNNSKVK